MKGDPDIRKGPLVCELRVVRCHDHVERVDRLGTIKVPTWRKSYSVHLET